jgi:hypothetical protein
MKFSHLPPWASVVATLVCLFSARVIAAGPVATQPATQPAAGQAACTSTAPAAQTCAVLPVSTNAVASDVAAVVEHALSGLPELRLVDRGALPAVLDEQLLSAVEAAEGVSSRLKLGQLVKADLLVLVRELAGMDGPKIELVVIVSSSGLRLAREAYPGKAADLETIAASARKTVEHALALARNPHLIIFAVPSFEHLGIVPERVDHRLAYAQLVELTLMRVPGAVVIELEEADALAREAVIGSQTLRRALPYYVTGKYRAGAGHGKSISFEVALRQADKVLGSETARAASEAESAAVLQDAVRKLIPPSVGGMEVTRAEPVMEARLLVERAHQFRSIGEWDRAYPLFQSALLLDSRNVDAHLGVFEALSEMMKDGRNELNEPAHHSRIDYCGRLDRWEECLDHIDFLLRQRAIDPRTTRQIDWFGRYAHLMASGPDARAQIPPLMPRYKQILRRQGNVAILAFGRPEQWRGLQTSQLQPLSALLVVTSRQLTESGEYRDALDVIYRAILAIGDVPEGFGVQFSPAGLLGWCYPGVERTAYADFVARLESSPVDQVRLVGQGCRLISEITDEGSYQAALAQIDALTEPASRRVHRELVRKHALLKWESLKPPPSGPAVAEITVARFVPFAPPNLRINQGEVSLHAAILGWIRCGNVDVVHTYSGYFRVTELETLEPIDVSGASSACWDGRFLWVVGSNRPRVLDLARGRVGQFEEAQDPDRLLIGGEFVVVSPGKVCLWNEATVGPMKDRIWGTLLEARERPDGSVACSMETLFQQRQAFDPLDAKLPEDPTRGFRLSWVTIINGGGESPALLLGRRNQRPLCIDLYSKKPRVLPHEWPVLSGIVQHGGDLYVSAGRIKPLEHGMIYRVTSPDAAPELWLDLPGHPSSLTGWVSGTSYYKETYLYGEDMHLFGASFGKYSATPAWTVVNLRTKEARVLLTRWPAELGDVRRVFLTNRYGFLIQGARRLYQAVLPPGEQWPRYEDFVRGTATRTNTASAPASAPASQPARGTGRNEGRLGSAEWPGVAARVARSVR